MSHRLALAVVALLVSACGSHDATHGGGRVAAPPAPARPTVAPTLEAQPARTVTFETTDGVTISASLRPGATVDAPAVILVHKLSSTHAEWAPLLERLSAQPALTTLAIDLRGHGDSTHGSGGRTLDWSSFDADAWRATALDVRAAVDYLSSPDAPVHPTRIAAVGASIGSSAVLAAAADEPRILAVVALSPGRAYHGFDAITPATHLGDRPLFALAAHDETDSVDMAQTLARLATRGTSMIVDGDAHGVDIFQTDPSTLERVTDFLRTALAAPPHP